MQQARPELPPQYDILILHNISSDLILLHLPLEAVTKNMVTEAKVRIRTSTLHKAGLV